LRRTILILITPSGYKIFFKGKEVEKRKRKNLL